MRDISTHYLGEPEKSEKKKEERKKKGEGRKSYSMMRTLPVGIESFERIRKKNYLYVDKTEYIYTMYQESIPLFYSAPRRFGKSLFIRTQKAFWEGRKELFHGLKIEELMGDEEWKSYPVFYFSFNTGDFLEKDSLEKRIHEHLVLWEKIYGNEFESFSLGGRFAQLLNMAHKQTGLRCVVLVDEYDNPLLDQMQNVELVDYYRSVMKGFFGTLKSSSDDIEFIFITGVTKFSKVSIFSDLNNLTDISMYEDYSALCGFTQKELEDNFTPEIRILANKQGLSYEACLEKLRTTYDGYRFSEGGVQVYNPFDVLSAFHAKKFGYYWFQSGTPTFLIDELQKKHYEFYRVSSELDYDKIQLTAGQLMDCRVGEWDLTPLLYQAGYLTITDYDASSNIYTLSYPNNEVKYAFTEKLLKSFLPRNNNSFSVIQLDRALEDGKLEEIKNILIALFANIPYTDRKDPFEYNFQAALYIAFTLLDKQTNCEYHTFRGRIDCNVLTARYIYLFEFKRDKTAEDALQQIEDNQYASIYAADKRKLYKIGVNFSSDTRNIDDWKVVER